MSGPAIHHHHDDHPVLITAAAPSFADEFTARRRRYSLIMAARIPCLVLAGILGIGLGWTVAAVVLIAASVPLPWVAVLGADDTDDTVDTDPTRRRAA